MSKPVKDAVRGDLFDTLPETRRHFVAYEQFHLFRIHLRNRVGAIFHSLFEGMFR